MIYLPKRTACFQHDMANEDFKYLPRRATSNKVLHNKAFNIAKMQNKMDNNMD